MQGSAPETGSPPTASTVSKSEPAHVAGFFFARCPNTPRGGGDWRILEGRLRAALLRIPICPCTLHLNGPSTVRLRVRSVLSDRAPAHGATVIISINGREDSVEVRSAARDGGLYYESHLTPSEHYLTERIVVVVRSPGFQEWRSKSPHLTPACCGGHAAAFIDACLIPE